MVGGGPDRPDPGRHPLHPSSRKAAAAAIATLGALTLSGLSSPASQAGSPHLPDAAGGSISAAALTPASLTPAALTSAFAGRGSGSRPNVLVFTADDASVSDLEHMPQVRRLLSEHGTTMTQAIAPAPICVPSRASLLTGQYAHNHGALTITGHQGGFASFRDDDTLPAWLADAGYHSTFAGKYLNGYGERKASRYVPPGWDDWFGATGGTTYKFFNGEYNHNGRILRRPEHNSDVLSDFTQRMIARRARSSRPWFAWVNFVAPHSGGKNEADDPRRMATTTPARRHRNMFRRLRLPDRPEMFVGGGSPWGGPVRPRLDAAAVTEVFQQRLESLQSVDEAVGVAVRALRRTGQLDDTYIMFTSDNGYLTGEHNRVGKLRPFDRSLRIPLVVRGPGIPAGRALATPTTVPDLAVTIAAIAGVSPGREVDGTDMLPYWRSSTTYDRIVPIEAYPVHNAVERMYSGIRSAQYTYVLRRTGEETLFDRAADPGELVNLASHPGYASVLRSMREWDARYRDCAAASCPGPETFTPR